MSQRDRLVAALDEAYGVEGAGQRPVEAMADALLARGVRVVDEDTLAAALDEINASALAHIENDRWEYLDSIDTAERLLWVLS